MLKTAVLCASLLALMCLFSFSDRAVAEAPQRIDIPAGDLKGALELLARQASVELVYQIDQVRGLKTAGVSGLLSVQEAATRLLTGTRLTVRTDANGAMLIAVPRAHSSSGGTQETVGVDASAAAPASALQLAQASADASADVPEKSSDKDARNAPASTGEATEVVVTGVRDTGVINQGVIPRQENQALRYEIIDRAAIERSGVSTLPELFRQVSSVANFGTGTQSAYGSQMATANGIEVVSDQIDLRGLGSSNTLIMVNGRRMYDGEESGADIGRIPLAAVERIEILPGSGSAIYGANATAGVVNIILRKEYSGTEMSASVGAATNGGAEEYRIAAYHGQSFHDGKTQLTMAFDFQKQDDLLASDRGYYNKALDKVAPEDTSSYISTIVQSFYQARGTVTAGGALGIPSDPTARFAAVPVGSSGVGLTTADFNGTAAMANVGTDRVERGVLLPGRSRYNLNTTLEREIFGENLGVYLNARFGYLDRGEREYVGLLGALTMLATDARNPFGRSVQVYMEPTDLPLSRSSSFQRTFNVVTGIRGQRDLLGRDLKWSIDGSWSQNESSADNVDYTRLVRGAVRAGLYNPLRDMDAVAPISAAEAENYYSSFRRRSVAEILATNWRANGGLFQAWGGEAKFSVGAELRFEYLDDQALWDYGDYASLVASGARASGFVDTSRRAWALYSEVVVPLVGSANRRPLMHAFDVVAAVRHEQYDDFGSAAPPMFAVRYSITEDLMLRGSWSRGFQPPTQSQLFTPADAIGPLTSILFIDRERLGLPLEPYTIIRGGNRALEPETSTSYDAGIVFTPRWLPALTFNASYFRYDKKDLVRTVSYQDAVDFPDLFPGRIARGPATVDDMAAGRPGPITEVDISYTNISRQLVDGWDFKATYDLVTEQSGTFTFFADGTYTKSFREQLRPGLDFADSVGDIGFSGSVPLEWRGKAAVQWQIDSWLASLTGRYIDSYVGRTNALGLDGDEISSSFEMDLQLAYSVPSSGATSGAADWLGGTKFTLSVLNLFDRTPPLRTERTNQWYSLFNDPRQRYVTLGVKKAF